MTLNESNTSLKFIDLVPALSANSIKAIQSIGFTHMTPVQASTIPLFLQNKDVCVEATTGSGKTLAFAIPIFEILIKSVNNDKAFNKHDVYALVIAPTRELATQIYDVIIKISKQFPQFRSLLFVGGTSVLEACSEYEHSGGNIIIGTPGRILDVKNRSQLINLKKLEVLILDEADTLLDMGFKDTIGQLLDFLPKQRRTGLFSATQTKEVRELARAGLRNPVLISVKVQGNNNNSIQNKIQQTTPSTLENYYLISEHDERPDELVQFIREHLNEKIIIFVATCACVDYYSNVFEQLANEGVILPKSLVVIGFHGKMIPKKRTLLYRKFISLSTGGIMFSTDVAARGVDIPDVDWIVQLAAPKDPAFFVHRVGRTARAGRNGGAVLFITHEELPYIELLRGRGVPLVEKLKQCNHRVNISDYNIKCNDEVKDLSSTSTSSTNQSKVLQAMKSIAMNDRNVLENGSTAFMSYLRAYKEHLCSYIFRFEFLDIGSVARAYGLLRLPKIPETRGVKGKPIRFEITNIDTSKVPYKHKEQELARQRRLQTIYDEAEARNVDCDDDTNNNNSNSNNNMNQHDGVTDFKPYDIFLKTKKDSTTNDDNISRKRKQKGGLHKKILDEWDDLAAEETAFKKYKKGLISKQVYEDCLFSEKKLAIDPITKEPLMEKIKKKEINDSGDDDDDDSSSNNSKQNKSKDGYMRFKYQDEISEDEVIVPNNKNKNSNNHNKSNQKPLKHQNNNSNNRSNQVKQGSKHKNNNKRSIISHRK